MLKFESGRWYLARLSSLLNKGEVCTYFWCNHDIVEYLDKYLVVNICAFDWKIIHHVIEYCLDLFCYDRRCFQWSKFSFAYGMESTIPPDLFRRLIIPSRISVLDTCCASRSSKLLAVMIPRVESVIPNIFWLRTESLAGPNGLNSSFIPGSLNSEVGKKSEDSLGGLMSGIILDGLCLCVGNPDRNEGFLVERWIHPPSLSPLQSPPSNLWMAVRELD